MFKRNICLPLLCCVALSAGCKQNEIITFSDLPGANFLRFDSREGWNETLGNLYIDRNFGIFIDEWDIPADTIYVQAKLEGMMSSEPIRIRLKYDYDPEQPHVEVIFRDDYAFAPGEYMAEFKIVVKRPPERDRLFAIPLTFDCENSDIIAGAVERQIFRLNIKDEYTFQTAQITDEVWENAIEPVLGPYSNTKMRFVAYALQRWNLSGLAGGVTLADKQTIVDKLAEYNGAHPGNPLRDENGEIVTFEPI